ncbi:MAG: VCBS repeat-containing protein [Planctomycetota bacterium]|nr:VCBS repeat-containing protein [Planctomycetota bacterium]
MRSLKTLCAALAVFAQAAIATPFAAAEDPAPIGTERFNTYALDFPGRAFEVFPQDINEDGLEDVVIVYFDDESETQGRLLTVYFQDRQNGFQPAARANLPLDPASSAVVLGNFDGAHGVDVGLITAEGVICHPFVDTPGAAADGAGKDSTHPTSTAGPAAFSAEARSIIAHKSLLDLPQPDIIFVWIGPEDLDNNGLHDIVLPRTDGYTVFFQTEPGVFGRTSEIEVPQRNEVVDSPFEEYVFERKLPRLVVIDFNGDGKKDLVLSYEDSFVCHLQDDKGGFPSAPSVKFASRFVTDAEKMNRIEASNIILEDLNMDGVPEMIVTRTKGEIGVFESIATDIYVLYGRAGAPYPPVPDQIVKIRGVSIFPQFVDVDKDGAKDVIISCFRTDLISVGASAAIDSFTFTYYIYLFDKQNGILTDVPAYDIAVSISREMLEKGGRSLPLVSFNSDFDNDGRLDMLTTTGDGVVSVHRGKRAVGAFHRSEVGFEKGEYLRMTFEPPRWIDTLDLNHDTRCDLLLRYGSRVIVLLSK